MGLTRSRVWWGWFIVSLVAIGFNVIMPNLRTPSPDHQVTSLAPAPDPISHGGAPRIANAMPQSTPRTPHDPSTHAHDPERMTPEWADPSVDPEILAQAYPPPPAPSQLPSAARSTTPHISPPHDEWRALRSTDDTIIY